MTWTVKLKKRYPPGGDRSHWVWLLRYWSADACKEIGEVIGWYAPARDPWQPKWCKGPRLVQTQAREIQVQRREDLRKGRVGQPEVAPSEKEGDSWSLPFVQWIALYVENTRGTVRDTTLLEINEALIALNKAASPATVLDVSHQTVKKFIQVRLRGGLKAEEAADGAARRRHRRHRQRAVQRSTVWKQISALRRVWYDAQIEPNPWAEPKLRRQLKSVPKDWQWYSTEHLGRLMSQCEAWRTREEGAGRTGRKWIAFKGMVAVAYTAGLRLGEINHLTWADVDLDAAEITISPKLKTETTVPWGPKDHERRVVPLTPTVQEIFAALRESAGDANPYIFVSVERHRHAMKRAAAGTWHDAQKLVNNVRRDFRKLCKAAGVPVCAFHSLRKSCCTNLLEGGVAPHAVQKILGHASLETTIKYYSKVRRDQIAVARGVSEGYISQRQATPAIKAKSA